MPSAPPPDDLVIGVDIGGTKVAAGLVDPSGVLADSGCRLDHV
jgi:predicted NBD/HSP70 family sugar kinase